MTQVLVRKYTENDVAQMRKIWNSVVKDGIAFPQDKELTASDASVFFSSQTFCAVAEVPDTGEVKGLYILHPNNVGRCGHICNASYAVDKTSRGQHIGEKLVMHCIEQAKKEGFRILQFNAVVETNTHARHLYERCGFLQLGTIPGGFLMKDGHYENICPYYISLT